MDSWVFQGGFPLVTVERTGDNGNALRFSQQPFTYLPATEPGGADRRWQVPLLYRVDGGGPAPMSGRVMIDREVVTVAFPRPIVAATANAGGHAFLRVRYDSFLAASARAHWSGLGAIERYNIVSDTWSSVLAGTSEVAEFVQLCRSITSERDPNVWAAVLGGLRALDALGDPAAGAALRRLVIALTGPVVEELGWEARTDESPQTKELRGKMIGALGGLGGDPATSERSIVLLERYLGDRGAVDADVAPAIMTIGALHGGAALYDRYTDLQVNGVTPQERIRFLEARGLFPEPQLVERTLADTLTDRIRSQDAPFLLRTMLGDRDNGAATWRFIAEHWKALSERVPDNAVVRMVEGLPTLGLIDPALAESAIAFFGPDTGNVVPQGEKQLAQHLERVRVNAAFRARVRAGLADALA